MEPARELNSQAAEGDSPGGASTASPVPILLVDDREEQLAVTEACLQGMGLHLVPAGSGLAAIRLAAEQDFALVILDVQMPGMSGFETAVHLIKQSPQLPIIFLTGSMPEEMHAGTAYDTGVVDYLIKPIVPQILRSKVAVFAGLYRNRVQLQDQLEEIRRLNSELASRAEELKLLNQELETYNYSVSHDLRAPLTSIIGFSDLLLEHGASALDATALDYLGRVRSAGRRMRNIIEGLLDLSKVTKSRLRWESVDLSALAEGIVAEFRSTWPERQVEVVISPGLRAMGDRRLLGIMLQNLLANAWKFTSRTAQAHIELGARPGEDAVPLFFLADNGAGFDQASADRLFHSFTRLHTLEEFEGTGIGLATVQRIVQRHGGQVWGEGREGLGATFYFKLPITQAPAGLESVSGP